MIALRIGLLVALGAILVSAEDEVMKCPGGECVKLHLCQDGEINTDGTNIIDIRFNADDPCEHYLLKCCKVPGEDDEDLVVPPPSNEGDNSEPAPDDGYKPVPLPPTDEGYKPVPPPEILNQKNGTGGGLPGGNGDNNGGRPGNNGGGFPGDNGGGQPGGNGGGDVPPYGPNPGDGGVKGDHGTTVNPIKPPVDRAGCGVRNADGVGFRITGDSDGESEYGEFPWMVAILKEEKALEQVINVYQCGGSLIHPQVVLTAAHCVQNKKPEEIKIRLGEWDTQTTNEIYDHQDRSVSEIVVHKDFYKGGLFNDVALLFLDKAADIQETVDTICLPPQDTNFDMSRCFASGWGKDVFGKEGKYQVILKKIELPIMPFNQCQTALRTTRLGKRFILNKSFICAGGEVGKDTCKGDGGSPLVCPISGTNRYYQAGIVAWGIGCGEKGIPGVYVNVAGFRNWIDEHLTQRSIPHNYYIYA